MVILETHQAQISSAALAALSDHGIGIMHCGKDHMPNALTLPIGAHSRHAAIVDNQLALPKPLKKRLWQKIVQAKLANQASVLDLFGLDGSVVKSLVKTVQSGDATNRESVAASAYFKQLLPQGGRRNSEFSPALDYGYSVLRAGIGRTAVAGGWLVSRGIHHSNNLNAFNLVDDLIEPFRPVIDLLAVGRNIRGNLTSDAKTLLASVFECKVSLPSGKTSVQVAIEAELDSLKAAILDGNAALLQLPRIVPLEKATLE